MNSDFKFPWGTIAGVFAIFCFYLTIGVVAAYMILSAVQATTGQVATLFDNDWQIALFAADVVCALGFVGCLALSLKNR